MVLWYIIPRALVCLPSTVYTVTESNNRVLLLSQLLENKLQASDLE